MTDTVAIALIASGATLASASLTQFGAWLLGGRARRTELERRRLDDLAHLRDERLATLRADLREFAGALFKLRDVLVASDMDPSADQAVSALEAHLVACRTSLVLDPDGVSLVDDLDRLGREVQHYLSMVRERERLTSSGAREAVVGYAQRVDAQRKQILNGIEKTLEGARNTLTVVATPVALPPISRPRRQEWRGLLT